MLFMWAVVYVDCEECMYLTLYEMTKGRLSVYTVCRR